MANRWRLPRLLARRNSRIDDEADTAVISMTPAETAEAETELRDAMGAFYVPARLPSRAEVDGWDAELAAWLASHPHEAGQVRRTLDFLAAAAVYDMYGTAGGQIDTALSILRAAPDAPPQEQVAGKATPPAVAALPAGRPARPRRSKATRAAVAAGDPVAALPAAAADQEGGDDGDPASDGDAAPAG